MFGNRAHEGLQPPSNLEERKGLKEAQYAAHVLSAAHPHPPRTRGVISASLEGSPSRPSIAPCVSASLEGSEPTRANGSTPPRSRPPLDGKDKTAIRQPARRTEALNANHSAAAPGSDGVRPPLRTVAVTRVFSTNSGHCTAIPSVAKMASHAIFQYNVLVIDIDNTTLGLI